MLYAYGIGEMLLINSTSGSGSAPSGTASLLIDDVPDPEGVIDRFGREVPTTEPGAALLRKVFK